MTSTTSLGNKVFIKLLKWAFVKNRSRLIVFSILMALGICIDLYMITNYSNLIYGMPNGTKEMDVTALGNIGLSSIVIAQLGAMLFSLIAAMHTFSFLHNKRTTDMFGALPATRGQLYFSHLISGMGSIMVPFSAGSFIVMAITCRSEYFFGMQLGFILFGLVAIAASFAFTALIAYCCGTIVDTALSTIGIHIIYTGMIMFFWSAATSMIPGATFAQIESFPMLCLFSPYLMFGFYDYYASSNMTTAMWTLVIWGIIYTAGMIILGYIAAKKRRAETAQNEFNISWLPIVIKAGISIVCGGLIGMFGATLAGRSFSNMIAFTIWYIIGGFAAFFILHLIFSRGLKGKFLPSFIAYIAATVVSVGAVFLLTTGLGIDTYVPDTANISSANTMGIEFKDPESIELITEAHKVIIEGEQKRHSSPYYFGAANDLSYYYDYNYEYTTELRSTYPLSINFLDSNVQFRYNKKIGFTTYRNYIASSNSYDDYDCEKLEGILRKLFSTDEFKKYDSLSLWKGDGARRSGKAPASVILCKYSHSTNPDYGDPTGYYTVASDFIKKDEKFVSGLYEALRQDIIDNKNYYNIVAPVWTTDPTVSIGDSFMSINVSYDVNNDYYGKIPDGVETDDLYVTIPNTYTRTINYLNQNGIDTSITETEENHEYVVDGELS